MDDLKGYAVHEKRIYPDTFERLDMLWEKYPQYREMTTFASLEEILEEHESYRDGFDEVRDEYVQNQYDKFLIQLSWEDLPYRYATRDLIEKNGTAPDNEYVKAFIEQFEGLDTDNRAYFLFPERFVSQFFVVMEVCKAAEALYPVRSLFPDETKVHYLAVFDKKDMQDILLMYHLLYGSSSQEVYGGYSLYDYALPWYHNHLWQDGTVLRSPYLPDRLAKFQGHLQYYHNPGKTVYVRRNIEHILECGYFQSELEFFLCLDIYIPSLKTAIEYQGIQHFHPVDFFGGEEALQQRRDLDEQKRILCEENGVQLIEWPYSMEPTEENLNAFIGAKA